MDVKSLLLCAIILCVIIFYRFHKKKSRLLIRDKAVLISGCDSGIGLRVAQHLSSLGFRVFAGCLDPQSEGSRSLSKDKATGKKIHLLPLDVTKSQSISLAVASIRSILSSHGTKGLFQVSKEIKKYEQVKVQILSFIYPSFPR